MGTQPAHREQQPAPAPAAAAAAGEDATANTGEEGPAMDETGEKEQETEAWSSAEAERHSTAAATAATESPESYSGGTGVNAEEQLQVQQQEQQQQEGEEQQQQEGEESEVEQRINEPSGSSSTCVLCNRAAPNDQQHPGDAEWVCDDCSSKQEQQGAPRETHGTSPHQLDESSGALEDTSDPSRVSEGMIGSSEYTAKNHAALRGSGSSSSSSSGGGGGGVSRGRGSPATGGPQAAAAAAAAASGSRKCIDEGSVRRHVVPVGPKHQVPCLPPFFLESGPAACCCAEGAPVLDASLTAKLVYSPSSLERVRQRRLAEGLADRAICSEGDMEAFMQQCAKNWKANKPGWQPFSPEFAFKLLHYAGYDPEKALQLMEDPQFPFQLVCDGPVRRYDNKWRPKDRRGVISPTPYPPPVFLRGYLSRRHYRDSSGYSLR